MLHALILAFAQLPERRLRGLWLRTLAWTLLIFAVLWIAGLHVLERAAAEAAGIAPYWSAVAGVLLLGFATWLLFVAVENTVLFAYAGRIVDAVDAHNYPYLPPPLPGRWRDDLASGLWLLLLTVFGNILVLPLYFLLPGANLVLFLCLNGYLVGRAYFDAVALRRMGKADARRLWGEYRIEFIVNGAISVLLLGLPIVNLFVPIIGLAAAVHLVERHRRGDPAGPGRGQLRARPQR
jgi:uncharacterized protein involved in cysteine biosynthesis